MSSEYYSRVDSASITGGRCIMLMYMLKFKRVAVCSYRFPLPCPISSDDSHYTRVDKRTSSFSRAPTRDSWRIHTVPNLCYHAGAGHPSQIVTVVFARSKCSEVWCSKVQLPINDGGSS